MSDQNQQPQQNAAGQPPPAAPPPAQPASPPPPPQGGKETVTDRIKRAKRAAVNSLLTDLGFDDVDTLKTALQTFKTAQSAIEAANGKASTAESAKAELEKELADMQAAAFDGKVNGAITSAVSSGVSRAQYPQDVVEHIRKNLGDKLKEAFDAEGKPDETKLTALIDEVKKQRPTWFGPAGAGSPSNRGGKPLDPNAGQADALKRASRMNQRIIRG